jgi:hypothetical protein
MQQDDTYAERIMTLETNPTPLPLSRDFQLLRSARIRAVACDVTILAAVVTSLVSRRLRAISRDVAHTPAVEAATVSSSRLVDHLSVISF